MVNAYVRTTNRNLINERTRKTKTKKKLRRPTACASLKKNIVRGWDLPTKNHGCEMVFFHTISRSNGDKQSRVVYVYEAAQILKYRCGIK